MSGRKSFKKLARPIDEDPVRRARVEEISRAYDVLLRLAELREARGATQAELASELGVSQPNVSKIEGKEDLYLSTLRGYVEALGGRLELRAIFPDQTIDLALPMREEPAQLSRSGE